MGNAAMGMTAAPGPTPPEVEAAMQENPECAFSRNMRSSVRTVNGDMSRETVQSWIMNCPNRAPVTVYEDSHTDTGVASGTAPGGVDGVGQGGGLDPWSSMPGLDGSQRGVEDLLRESGMEDMMREMGTSGSVARGLRCGVCVGPCSVCRCSRAADQHGASCASAG